MTTTSTRHAAGRPVGQVADSRPVRLAPLDVLGLGLLGIRTRKVRAAPSALGIATLIVVTGIPASSQKALMERLCPAPFRLAGRLRRHRGRDAPPAIRRAAGHIRRGRTVADHLIAESDTAELYPALLRALSPLNRAGTDLPTRAKDIDLVSVGALALADPDLVERLRSDAPLNTPDPSTFYGGGVAGHTDYPTHTA